MIDQIIQSLKNSVDEAHTTNLSGDLTWTKLIKQNLAKLGENHGYETCASGTDFQTHSEWLFDLVWFSEEGEEGNERLAEVFLIMESEWNSKLSEIKYDFEKLLVGNSPIKLMICQSIDPINLFPYFEEAISKFKLQRANETYIIAILEKGKEEFAFKTITT